jgi:hypothetical protein
MGLETISNPILLSIRLMQNTHLRLCVHPLSWQRISLHASFLRISVALDLGFFAQPYIGFK